MTNSFFFPAVWIFSLDQLCFWKMCWHKRISLLPPQASFSSGFICLLSLPNEQIQAFKGAHNADLWCETCLFSLPHLHMPCKLSKLNSLLSIHNFPPTLPCSFTLLPQAGMSSLSTSPSWLWHPIHPSWTVSGDTYLWLFSQELHSHLKLNNTFFKKDCSPLMVLTSFHYAL